MQHHIKARGPNRWPTNIARLSSPLLISLILLILLILVSGNEAIVKQQQRSDDSQQQSSNSPQQSHHSSSGYNNHQSSAPSSGSQASQPVYSSSVSVSSSSAGSPVSTGQSASAGQQYNGASEQSYQAASNSVNMALANSGIYGSGSTGYSQASASASPSQSAQSLNPVHYFYYPAKQESNSAPAKPSMGGQPDSISNGATSNYQSMAYPSYADQLSSALSSMGSGGPEAAASSQDPSYLPQPAGSMGADSNSNGQQGSSMYGGQPQQQQPNGAGHQQYGAEMAGYSGQPQPQHQPQQQQHQAAGQQSQAGSISFNGPSSNGPTNDYLNAQMGGSSGPQMPPMSAYHSQLYNQMGDLSTSNFGNNAGGLSSVASYMSPGQQQSAAGQQQPDLFSSGGQQFSSAASQLSPSAVMPPSGQQAGALGPASSLFSAASSLFGHQAGNSAASNLFANQQYLNSFLSPQQYGQLAGHQLGEQPMAAAASHQKSALASASGSKSFGISSFIVPMLALAGLSLLIPTMSNIGTAVGRRKRSVEERASSSNRQQQIAFEPINGANQIAKELSIGEYMDKIERYYSIYKNAVENESCLNRLICEFGDAVKDVTGRSAVVTVIEKLAPTWMTGKVHLFKGAALDSKEGKEECKQYVCHSSKRQN